MRKSFKSVVAGVAALCVAGVISAVGATSASAATQPFDPTQDANWVGSITFYNAAGNVVTSGDATDPQSTKYMVGSVNPAGASTVSKTQIQLVGPQPATNPGLFSGPFLNGTTLYPLAAPAPAVVSSATTPQGLMLSTSTSLAAATGAFVAQPAPLTNVYQVRLKSLGTTGPLYNATTISIDPVTHVWTQIDPGPKTATTTTLTVSPASPVDAPANLTLSAVIATTTPGSVEFFDGTTSLGTSPVSAAGTFTKALTAVPVGNYSYTATFTPTDAVNFASSTSSVVPFVVQIHKTPVTVGLSATAIAPFLGIADTFSATASAIGVPVLPGTFQFFDGATSLGAASATTTLTTSTLGLGVHPITVKFIPTDLATYTNLTTSPVVSVNVLAVQLGACATTPANCTDAQTFTAEVAAGSLVIHTPYTVATPFNLGILGLNTGATMLSSGPKAFGTGNNGDGVTITDTRSGGLGWIASLQSSDFTVSGTSSLINARNLGFTQVLPSYLTFNGINAATNPVATHDNAASNPAVAPGDAVGVDGLAASKAFADIATHTVAGVVVGGAGSVQVNGNMTLNAPTSTPAGIYFGTVTFTIA
jgi:hypothetical protein